MTRTAHVGIWTVAITIEACLYIVGTSAESSGVSVGGGIALALTQLPGSYVARILVPSWTPLWCFDVVMFVTQATVFAGAIYSALFIKGRQSEAYEPPSER